MKKNYAAIRSISCAYVYVYQGILSSEIKSSEGLILPRGDYYVLVEIIHKRMMK